MKPFRDLDLSVVVYNQWDACIKTINGLSNEEIMANDIEILAENIFQRYYISPVEIFDEDVSKRGIRQGVIKQYVDPFIIGDGESRYVDVDGIIAKFYFPYQGDSRLFKCKASTYSLSGYPDITVNDEYISFRIEKPLYQMKSDAAIESVLSELKYCVNTIKSGIGYANKDICDYNRNLKSRVLNEIRKKKDKVQLFFDIAKKMEVPVKRKDYAKQHISLIRNVVPIAHKYDREDYYCIEDVDYRDILGTIKHTASTYERTPSSYKSMGEEDLRNTLLASLNATYKGDATGEAFRNNGKTDICIERKNRAAFVAECKMWTGQAQVEKAVKQLDSYLTWRDCKTALIYFVRRKDFLGVLESAEHILRKISIVRSVRELDKNEFECLFISDSTPGQLIQMRVMLFNLFS